MIQGGVTVRNIRIVLVMVVLAVLQVSVYASDVLSPKDVLMMKRVSSAVMNRREIGSRTRWQSHVKRLTNLVLHTTNSISFL
jgi:hypothetical protein